MRLLVDIYDASGNRQGDGPIVTAKSVNVTRVLDGIGTLAVDFPGTDKRALDLIANKRRAHVFLDPERGTGMRELGQLIIEKIGAKDQSGGYVKTIDGPDNLGELKFTTTRRGRKYEAQTVQAIVDDLLGLTTGWVRSGTATQTVSARFDGASILKAIQSIVQGQGLHFRQAATFGTLEIGAFGDSATLDTGEALTVVNRETAPPDLYDSDDLLLIDSLTLVEDSEDLINWLEPLGAGEGDAALTLEKSTRSIATGYAYDIQTEAGPDGRTVYYIADSASVSAYGQVEKTGTFKEITLTDTTETAQVAAANALYDMAAAWLARYAQKYDSYSLTVRKPAVNLLPGDKIRVRDLFRVIDQWGDLVDVRSINADFWIMRVAETVGQANEVQLQIASVDRVEQDSAQVVLGALEDIRIQNVSIKPYFSHYTFNEAFEVDSTHSATFELVLTNKVQAINQVLLRIVTTPFRATASAAASGGGATSGAGGDHYHQYGLVVDTTSPGGSNKRIALGYNASGSGDPDATPLTTAYIYTQTTIPNGSRLWTTSGSGDHTHSTPNHTHDLSYGINDDTDYPDHVSVTVNGTSVASNLDTGGTGLDQTIDITDEINGAANLQQAHSIVVACTGGQGLVKITLDVFETIQSVSKYS